MNLRPFAVLLLSAAVCHAGEKILPVPNGDFEQGLSGWSIPPGERISSLSTEQAASGRYSLKIADAHPINGSSATSARVAIDGAWHRAAPTAPKGRRVDFRTVVYTTAKARFLQV